MKGNSNKPMVLYGEGGCGKTSLLAKSAGLTGTEWFKGAKPVCIIRFLGTTPDSSALTPTLISICQQVGEFNTAFDINGFIHKVKCISIVKKCICSTLL